MGKIITTSFAINKGKGFFNDKKAKTLTKLNNMNGDEVEKGAIVTITGRGDTKSLFNIEDEKGVIIRNTWCENLELED
jgi:hypothetical protein